MAEYPNRKNKPKQEWNPHWLLKLLCGLWSAAVGMVKIAAGAAATVLLIALVCVFVFVGILGNYLQDDILPEANYNLENATLDQTSFVYYVDAGGNIQLLQQIYTSADRQWASLEEIPEDLVKAAVAIEDKRFYEHQGVDWITTVKACANMFFGGGDTFGGSTITQQLIKNLTGEDSVTVQRKVMEIFRAQKFEKNYDKDTIMEWYLNTIYLGRGCYGVRSAAAEYFGKEIQMLTTAECASLISITNNPSIFNPFSSTFEWDPGDEEGLREMTGKERNRVRQVNTLWVMREEELITEEEYQAALDQEMVFKIGIDAADKWTVCERASCAYEGIASSFVKQGETYACPVCGGSTVLAEDASKEVYSYFVDTVLEDVAADLAASNGVNYWELDKVGKKYWSNIIQRGGFHIYSTLDMNVQNAIDAVYTDLSKIPTTRSKQQLQSGIVIIDNRSGDIVGLAGGVGEKTEHDGWNIATDSRLQTGSAQKPLSVYAPAFEAGAISPVTVIPDLPVDYTDGAFPKNDSKTYSYSRTILSGITSSINAVSVRTLRMIGYDYAYSFSKDKFGLSDMTDHYVTSSGRVKTDLGDSPMGMGALTVGASIRDVSAAYATFANNGVYREARTYTKVYDSQGNLVLDNTQESEKILSDKTVNYMNYCLHNAATNGTGTAAVFSGHDISGKTGTTSSNRDRWFCGYTGYYTAAIWCGYKQPEEIRLSGNQQNPACRLFKMVMEPLHKGKSRVSLYSTSGMRGYTVCLDTGLLATSACSNDVRSYLLNRNRVASAYAYPEDAPTSYCNRHVMVEFCSGGGVATDYCYRFADAGQATIGDMALVKLTSGEVSQIKTAGKYGLGTDYRDNRYVYYISESGGGLNWHGFDGNANSGISAPYVVCPAHNSETWNAYLASLVPETPTDGSGETTVPEGDHGIVG